jgi:HlyD family secretion protein
VKKILTFLVLMGVVLAAGAYWLNSPLSGSEGAQEYILTPIDWGTIRETVSASGLLQPKEAIAVGSELSGRVVKIYPTAHVNNVVQPGEPLLKLDDRIAQQRLEQANVAVRMSQADLARAEALREAAQSELSAQLELHQKELASKYAVERARAQVRAAEAALETAQVKIDEARAAQKLAQIGVELMVLRAPTGDHESAKLGPQKQQYTIIDRKVVLGQLIAPPASAQLFTLTNDLSRLQVHIQVSENDIGKIRVGLPVTFTVYAEADARFQGGVAEIRAMPTNVHGAVFYDTIVDVANERDPSTNEWKLRPGMTAAVDIILRQHTGVWKIPAAALTLQLDERPLSEAARAKLAQSQSLDNSGDWKPVWTLDKHGKPWPILVRLGSKDTAGETGIADTEFSEVLEFDPELNPKPDPQAPSTYLKVLTGTAAAEKKGLFDRANVKVF